jgi:hypothetical protein
VRERRYREKPGRLAPFRREIPGYAVACNIRTSINTVHYYFNAIFLLSDCSLEKVREELNSPLTEIYKLVAIHLLLVISMNESRVKSNGWKYFSHL